jgi:hypothetical protein
MAGVVAQRAVQLQDRAADAVLELDNGLVRPERFPDLVVGDHVPRALQQEHQHLKRLVLERDLSIPLPEPCGAEIEPEGAEACRPRARDRGRYPTPGWLGSLAPPQLDI